MRFARVYQFILGPDLPAAQLFCRLDLNFTSSSKSFFPDFEVPYSTPFTTAVVAAPLISLSRSDIPSPVILPTLRAERTALLISSTSWTADEDFGLLIEALEIYNRVASSKEDDNDLPRILVMITGKGPLKDVYMGKIQRLQHAWDFVRCISTWLETLDYPLLLGYSSFHYQYGGGIDELQYRIRRHWNIPPYQFIGTGPTHEDCRHVWVWSPCMRAGFRMVSSRPEFRPCLTEVDTPSLQELVRPGWNGLIFRTSEELAGQLIVCPQPWLYPLALLTPVHYRAFYEGFLVPQRWKR